MNTISQALMLLRMDAFDVQRLSLLFDSNQDDTQWNSKHLLMALSPAFAACANGHNRLCVERAHTIHKRVEGDQ